MTFIEGRPWLLELPLFDRSYITSYSWSVVTTALFCTVSEILHLYSVRDCLWPWEVLQFI